MINSMTAFARQQRILDCGILTCECRSVNHRYLEVGLHLPEALRALETALKEKLREYVRRGKVECWIRFQPDIKSELHRTTINTDIVKNLAQACGEIAKQVPNCAAVSPFDILHFPGVLEKHEIELAQLQDDLLTLMTTTLAELSAARQREGTELTKLLMQRIEAMEVEFVKVRERLPIVMHDQKNKLLHRFNEASLELDLNRLAQEMVMFAQRIDIAEEVERAETHIAELKRILQQGGVVGRQLDFLLQELNREANTLGSKSVDSIITHAAVALKVLIEQMKEQVQNIE